MDRRDYYFGQVVTDAELDAGFTGAENADRNMMLDAGVIGALIGLAVGQHNSGDLNVVVTAGVAYDKLGERCAVPTQQLVDLSKDHLGVNTAVSGGSNSKIVSLFLKFARGPNVDPRVDDNSNPVVFQQDESFSFFVVQGAESSSTPTPPTLLTDGILLADVTLIHAQTQILTANIATSGAARREDQIAIGTGIPHRVRVGHALDAFAALLDIVNQHVSGTADKHPATDVTYAGGGSWAGGTSPTNPATSVEGQLDKMIVDLSAATSGASGADRIGSFSLVGTSDTISSGTLFAVLTALKNATHLEYGGGGQWNDTTTNPATTVENQLDKIISDLTTFVTNSGASKLSCHARTTWLGGRTNPSNISVYQAIDKIITDLSAATAADDGAKRIGAEAGSAGYAAGSVRSQLDAIGPTAATAYTGAKTFDNISVSATNHYKVSSRSVTRSQSAFMIDAVTSLGSAGALLVPANGSGLQPVDLPDGGTLTALLLMVDPTNSTPPAGTKIALILTAVDLTTGVQTQVVTSTTDLISGASYGAAHVFTASGLSVVIDRTTKRYYLSLVGETGTGAASCSWIGTRTTCTITQVDEAAC